VRVGVVGAGQLGRMLALAGQPLGLRLTLLDPADEPPAAGVGELLQGAYDDGALLAELASHSDVVTFEFENVPAAGLAVLGRFGARVAPPPSALAVSQDRLAEKRLFRELGIATAPHAQVDDAASLRAALDAIGPPAILKTRRLGYDGKGQARVDDTGQAERALGELGGSGLVLEGRVRFARELSILGVRRAGGETAFYPLVENEHRDGILRVSRAPAAGVSTALQAEGEALAARVLERLDHVGVLAVELFETEAGLVANELAPRVHNSGHWTIEGAETSQFENHLRAICGLPLGSTAPRGVSAMVNLIGSLPAPEDVLAIPGAHLHLYGKAARPGRKLGHVTVTAPDGVTLRDRLEAVLQVVGEAD
jgi:5-(carboxyamino)imidazole ribonucleotide synthase